MRTIAVVSLFVIAAAAVPASSQDGLIEFRVVPVAGNPTGCTSLDASLSRMHTLTPAGDKAVLKSAGGINDTLKQTSPQIYRTTFRLGDVTLEVVADASRAPRTLGVSEPKRGCRWQAVAT